jgi:hypothetical protein
LVNSSKGIDDVWTEYIYDYDYSPPNLSKSRQSKPFWSR